MLTSGPGWSTLLPSAAGQGDFALSIERPDVDLAARVARLTAGQRACLELVNDHATSKEIARQLGISRHTVDARLRQAIQILGVTSRREAAVIWRAAASAGGYQPFAYQTPGIAGGPEVADIGRVTDIGNRRTDALDGLSTFGRAGAQPEQALPPRAAAGASAAGQAPETLATVTAYHRAGPSLLEVADGAAASATWGWGPGVGAPAASAPQLRLWGGMNDLTLPQRIAGILIISVIAMLAFGLLLSGIAALVQLRA